MKRLYVRPGFAGLGSGAWWRRLRWTARCRLATVMLLDTLDDMEAARGLRGARLQEILPYYFNPIPGAHYLKAELEGGPRPTTGRMRL